jgi:hypothetical protein
LAVDFFLLDPPADRVQGYGVGPTTLSLGQPVMRRPIDASHFVETDRPVQFLSSVLASMCHDQAYQYRHEFESRAYLAYARNMRCRVVLA